MERRRFLLTCVSADELGEGGATVQVVHERRSRMSHATQRGRALRRAEARLRILKHYEEVTHNVSPDRSLLWHLQEKFYSWRERYQRALCT
jgi:hypothetical protein